MRIIDPEHAMDSYPEAAVILSDAPFEHLRNLIEIDRVKSAVFFTGRRSLDASGTWQDILDVMSSVDSDVERFSDIEPEPSIDTVRRMAALLKTRDPDVVVAIGGGSVIDAAKAANLSWQTGADVAELFGVQPWSSKNPNRTLKRIIAVPTTSGTGSEVTPYANIVDPQKKLKKLIVERELVPSHAFVSASLNISCPASLTLACGCDALAHCVEGLLSNASAEDADEWAFTAVKLVMENLPKALADGRDNDARTGMAMAATLGGMVISRKPTGLPHLCSYAWAGVIEHGLAVACVLPHAWAYYLAEPNARETTERLAPLFASPGASAEEVVKGYVAFLASIGAPARLSDVKGMTPSDIDRAAESAAENPVKLATAPRPVPLDQSRKILGDILRGAWTGELPF